MGGQKTTSKICWNDLKCSCDMLDHPPLKGPILSTYFQPLAEFCVATPGVEESSKGVSQCWNEFNSQTKLHHLWNFVVFSVEGSGVLRSRVFWGRIDSWRMELKSQRNYSCRQCQALGRYHQVHSWVIWWIENLGVLCFLCLEPYSHVWGSLSWSIEPCIFKPHQGCFVSVP